MQFNIMWSGIEYHSLENCLAAFHGNSAHIRSSIVGSYDGKIYRLEYRLTTNGRGHTMSLELNFQGDDKIRTHQLIADGNGNWKHNGKAAPAFAGCIDVDIPLTPFTNTLPIRRLGLKPGESTEILVLYCDLLNDQLITVKQLYKCLSSTEYHYENVPNDFEANITSDEAGLVVDYPQLFVRINILEASYPEINE
ncbi:MAG TPA: putative glycolipid-binding domain-containing protein [Chryseolinea sp.]|nr:putative glycolipid-binding domain-containing protein [Chryseolinea sp.]